MADKSEISLNGKPISTLRVVDLKQELEKRGLSKSGSKKDLVDRLKLQLQIERLHNSSEKSEVEPSDRSADLVPNISLQDDVIAEQNDFIKKYLADQQKSYAIQKEARRLVELENYRSSDAEASSSQEEEGSPEKDDNKRKGKLNEEHIKVGEEIAVDQLGDVSSPEKKSRRRTRTSSNQENKDSEEKDELSFKQPSEPQITKTPEKTRRRTRSSLQSEDKDIEVGDICDQTKDGEFIETQGNTSVKTEEINHETEPENKTLHPQENYEGMMINLDTAEEQTDQSAVKVEVQSTGKNQEKDVEETDNKNTYLNDKQPDGKDINKIEELEKSSLDLQTEIQVEVNTKDSIKNKTLTEITDKGKEKVKEDTNNCNKIENEPANPPRTRRIQRNYWKFRRDSEKLKEGTLSESKMSLEMMTEQSKEESLTKEDEQMQGNQEREQSKEQSSTNEEKIQRTEKNTKEYENKLVLGMSQKVEPIPPLEEEMKTDVNEHQDEAKKLCIKELNIEERNTKTENKEQEVVDKFKKHQDLDQKMDATHEDVLERSKLEERNECIEAETDEKDHFRNNKKEVDREQKTNVENYLCEVGRENEQDFNKKKKEITDKEQKKENDEIQNKHETSEMVRIENEQESIEEEKNEIKIKLNEQESKIGQEQKRQSEFKAGLNLAKQLKTTTEQEQQPENSGTERKQAGQVDDKADIKLAEDLRTKEQVGQAEFNAGLKLIKILKIKAEQDQTENLGTKQEQAGQLEVKENLKLTKALETTIDKEQAENLGTKQEQGEEVEFKGNLKLAKTLETITEQEQAEVEVKGDLKLTKVLESTVGQEQAEEMDMKNVQLQSMDLEGREDQEYIENIETKISVVQAVESTVSQEQAEEMDLKNMQIQTKDLEDIEQQKYTENIETKISVVQAVESTVGQKQAAEMDIRNIQVQTKDLEGREEHVENVETKISVVQAVESTVEQEQAEEMDIKNIQVQTKDLEGREEHVENVETKISVEQAVENTSKVDQEPTKCIVLDYQNKQMVGRRIHDDNERFSESKRNWDTDDDIQRVNVSKVDEMKELEEKACVSEKKNSQEIDVQNGNLFTSVCDSKEESDVKAKENQEVFSQHELDQKHEEEMAHENSVKSGKKTGLTKKQVVDTKEDKCTTKTVKEFSKSISKTKSFKKDSYSSVGQKSEETDVSRKDGECSPSSLIVDPDIPESSKSQTCRKSRNRSRERNGNKQHKSSSSVSSSSSRSSRSSSCSRSSSQNSGQSSRRNSSRSSSRSRSSSPESQQEKNRNKKSRSQSSTPEPNVNDVDSKDRVITVSYEKKEEPESVVNEKFSPARDVDILEVTVDEHKKEIIEEGIQAKEEKKRPPINLTPRRLSVRGNKDRETVKSDEISQPRRKRKWATSMNSIPKVSLSISTDALKNLLPEDVPETPPTPENPSPDPVPNSESANSPEDGPPPPKREIKLKRPEIKIEPRAPSKEPEEVNDAPLEEVEIVEIKENKEHTPSPAKNPKSNIIFIRNLVRPFTLLQLKDLLAKTGTLVDGGFWIDKIKSKCCVTYETEEQAEETRKALHGVQWPISNPKTLIVDFATKEELDQYLYEEIPPIKKTVLTEDKSKEHKHRDEWLGDRKKAKDVEENERKKEKNRSVRQRITAPIREWDVGKLPLESPERDEEKKRLREKEKDRSAEKKKEKKDSRHKQEEETSAKLLDDLFRKTKTTPCIYWLPLTEEQIQSRIEERKQRQVERERRRREEEDMRSQRKEKSRGSRSRSRSPATRRR